MSWDWSYITSHPSITFVCWQVWLHLSLKTKHLSWNIAINALLFLFINCIARVCGALSFWLYIGENCEENVEALGGFISSYGRGRKVSCNQINDEERENGEWCMGGGNVSLKIMWSEVWQRVIARKLWWMLWLHPLASSSICKYILCYYVLALSGPTIVGEFLQR